MQVKGKVFLPPSMGLISDFLLTWCAGISPLDSPTPNKGIIIYSLVVVKIYVRSGGGGGVMAENAASAILLTRLSKNFVFKTKRNTEHNKFENIITAMENI